MTQLEFERQLAALKADKNRELEAVERWQVDIKSKVAEHRRRCKEAELELTRLKAEQRGLAARRVEVERKWSARLEQFKCENYSERRKLESVSDFGLVKELARRGWHGTICNDRVDMEESHKECVAREFKDAYACQ